MSFSGARGNASQPKASTNFFDVFSFGGRAPERINGRLAMIGFVAAIGVELANGGDLSAQLSSGGFSWFLGSSALLTLASLVPLFQGVTTESKYGGIMSADAEIWDGRFAMLGLVALAFTEYVKRRWPLPSPNVYRLINIKLILFP
ncbi:Early light-induced protein 1, chloroplastic [Datura stramonium]|uniref:Early light-induced protein 1, chloroplastic n=1 Tax=Datura stramonium TaxID=4076 RepID=A0ABS8SZQ0_DATST|nr:Early light-induced protein 1, chloroplastic [Datura stramonium]